MTESADDQRIDPETESAGRKKSNWIFKLITYAITIVCFYLVFNKTEATAAREGLTVLEYLSRFFAEADWTAWLALMGAYSLFFILVDSAIWRAVRWFNVPELKLRSYYPFEQAPTFYL